MLTERTIQPVSGPSRELCGMIPARAEYPLACVSRTCLWNKSEYNSQTSIASSTYYHSTQSLLVLHSSTKASVR